MDKIFGEIDYVEAGERETEAEKVENVTYVEAHARTGSLEGGPKEVDSEHVETKV